MVANEVLNNPVLSLKAKGLFSYLFSKPDTWDFSADRIQNECAEERKTILRVLKELEEAGYLERQKLPSGRVSYYLKYSVEPKSHIGTETKRHGGKVVPISNTDSDSNKEQNSNSVSAASRVASKDIQECLDLFQAVNPSHERLFSNKTQRAACERLIAKYGRPKVEGMIRALPGIIVQKTAPRITTPYMLEARLGELVAFVQQNRGALAGGGKGKQIIGLRKKHHTLIISS